LIFVDAGFFAIELFEFVESSVFIELRRINSLDFATIIQRYYSRRSATGKAGHAQREQEGGG
jgi:hypothetical protein